MSARAFLDSMTQERLVTGIWKMSDAESVCSKPYYSRTSMARTPLEPRKYVEKRVGWLVGCFGFNGPLRQYFSLYQAVSQREGEREEKG